MGSTALQKPWQPHAAYLYILDLDAPALAWEYLRRNLQYHREWELARTSSFEHDSSPWHCRCFKDPSRDSRSDLPDWIPITSSILMLAGCDDCAAFATFSLWRIPGAKILYRNGKNLCLTVFEGAKTWRLLLSADIADGVPFAFQIPAGFDPRLACPLISRINALMSTRSRAGARQFGFATRPSRDAILHMRTLQALDGDAAGASHRDIAEAIFGAGDVWRRWGKDSELRSHVRYLLRRGRRLVNGGYVRLLSPRQRAHG